MRSTLRTLLATSATAAFASGCAVSPPIQETTAGTVEVPYGTAYGLPFGAQPSTTSSVRFAAGPTLGVCVGDQSTTPANANNPAVASTVQALSLSGDTQLRTSFTLSCGMTNPSVINTLAQNKQTVASFMASRGRPLPAAPKTGVANVQSIQTGYYVDAARQVSCSGTLILVEPEPGVRIQGLPAGTILKEWGNMKVPAGMIAPTQPVMNNGRLVSSTLHCSQRKNETVPQ